MSCITSVGAMIGQLRRDVIGRLSVRDGLLENLAGGEVGVGGGGVGSGRLKYKKNIRAREKLNEKNSWTPINPKKYSCYGLRKIPHSPHNISNGPSLKP